MKRMKPEHAKLLQSGESSGAVAETQPLTTSTDAPTSESATSGTASLTISPPSDVTTPAPSVSEAPVMQRLRQKAREEAENGSGAPKGKHPYEYSVASFSAIPAAFRDENGDVDHDKINTHLQDLYDHDRSPIITGLMIGRRVHS